MNNTIKYFTIDSPAFDKYIESRSPGEIVISTVELDSLI